MFTIQTCTKFKLIYRYWMPLVWATNIINRARKDGLITSDHIVQTLLMELSDIRRRLGALIGYDTVSVPLVYTQVMLTKNQNLHLKILINSYHPQVVTLVLYTYFIAALMGRQMVPHMPTVDGKKYEDPDLYFPLFTALQVRHSIRFLSINWIFQYSLSFLMKKNKFCFYVGWLKVAEVLINPFGEDDDDIELNWLIDRHIKVKFKLLSQLLDINNIYDYCTPLSLNEKKHNIELRPCLRLVSSL
jgi:bestrophin, other